MANIRILIASCLMLLLLPQLALASKSHVARKGESLHSIARKYDVTVEELKSSNGLTSSAISKGMRLAIPAKTGAARDDGTVALRKETYTVVKGDSLPKIARKTGVKIADLKSYNNLKGNGVKAGQLLTVMVAAQKPVRPANENRLQRVNKDLLNEQELNETLAELTDIEIERPNTLAKELGNNQEFTGIKKSAYSFLGARYRFGGSARNALDCSSFTQQVFRELSVKLPRTAREQFNVGNEVVRGDLQKGDLVFFQTYARFPSHVGIYLGNRKMIHASSRDRRVIISSMDSNYYLSRYLGARRMTGSEAALDLNDLLQGVEEERDTDATINDHLGLSLTSNQ